MKIIIRKNRLVRKLLINQRGIIKTDQVIVPPNAERITGVNVSTQLLQVAPINAVNRYYFGANPATSVDAPTLVGLSTGVLDSNTSVTVQGYTPAGANDYLWYAHPVWLSNPKFNFGGFVGGFLDFGTVDLTTQEGIFTYRAWRSLNVNLGNPTITIVH